MSGGRKSVFVNARPLIFRSIDGKSSIFSDSTIVFLKKIVKIGRKNDFAKKVPKYIDFLSRIF